MLTIFTSRHEYQKSQNSIGLGKLVCIELINGLAGGIPIIPPVMVSELLSSPNDQGRTRIRNRTQKVLDRSGIRIGGILSDLFSKKSFSGVGELRSSQLRTDLWFRSNRTKAIFKTGWEIRFSILYLLAERLLVQRLSQPVL
ncbi:MAG: hypothetical protein OXE41_09735 [Gammaproteobacteria bacterium]|nr:hypothetical protein [Gammaproteobacteria bacterium]MCY4217825.1 hypothetical protein [Gammaproteobacteria bacterium]MCY4275654.1 hypothetical protein [Gammaproteobacteria bacterium]